MDEKQTIKQSRSFGTLGQRIRSQGMSTLFIAFCDIICVFIAWYGALWIRYDFQFAGSEIYLLHKYIFLFVVVTLAVYIVMGLYRPVWSFFGVHEYLQVFYAHLILIPLLAIIRFAGVVLPVSVYFLAYAFNFIFCAGIRLSYRALILLNERYGRASRRHRTSRTMIIGAGAAGIMVLRELNHSADSLNDVICVIDDNQVKWNRRLDGIPIIGGRESIVEAAEKYNIEEIIFAIPAASGADKKAILDICSETGCVIKKVPGIFQLVNDEVTVSQLKAVEVEDLLGRDPVKVNMSEIQESIGGKVCMVTGGGGSIGSELCRQIAACNPKALVVVDIYENNAYDLQQEIKRQYGDSLNLQVRIASVRNKSRIDELMEEFKPDIVYHAAAHKHVPLMEDSPTEAIKNNVFGTYNVARSAAEHGVKRMLLISTDKAVNPTNIMGASKRLCEMVIQMMERRCPDTCFMAVRFGNVLGSNGSVIPLFKKQIAEGGPVTVTDKNIIRYFMTIPEAVTLVLQASYYAKGGEIFILDMGEPVKIDDMARNLIRLSGYKPDVDIQIVYTGLRPGEKLYEELLMAEEGMGETANNLIHIGKPIEMDDRMFETNLERLWQACQAEDPAMKAIVAEIVPTYHLKS